MNKFKILVVDDDDNLALLIKVGLRAAEYEVKTANSAAEAIQTFLRFKPQLVLTDIGIGEENGLDLIERIRSHCGPVKTIYMTGDLGRYDAALAQEKRLHHASVIGKPFSYHELIMAVPLKRMINRKRHRATLGFRC
jgi:two-component system, NtrC family, response regulator AtoC